MYSAPSFAGILSLRRQTQCGWWGDSNRRLGGRENALEGSKVDGEGTESLCADLGSFLGPVAQLALTSSPPSVSPPCASLSRFDSLGTRGMTCCLS